MNVKNVEEMLKIIDIKEVNTDNIFLHYTSSSNLNSIAELGLQPKIGINAKVIESNKKIFFSIGEEGALVIMDVWIKWLLIKPKSNYIYWFGAQLLKIPFFPKVFHKLICDVNKNSKNKKYWSFNKLKEILDNSVYLMLDLEENVDFNYNDIDEAKYNYRFAKDYIELLYTNNSDSSSQTIEYWNMHTIPDKVIEAEKLTLLKVGDDYSASAILKYIASNNIEFIKENCIYLNEYLNMFK